MNRLEEIDKALFNPVWEQVRKPAPWETEGENWQARAMAEAAAEEAAPFTPPPLVFSAVVVVESSSFIIAGV